MSLNPMTQWICDECGQIIACPADGWLEWTERAGRMGAFRIVHHLLASPRRYMPTGEGCYYPRDAGHVQDTNLPNFVGQRGLVYLLSRVGPPRSDAEFLEIIRRLHLPHYEEARQYLVRAANDGLTNPDLAPWHQYFQERLTEIIRRYEAA